jgi:hypothetical protein
MELKHKLKNKYNKNDYKEYVENTNKRINNIFFRKKKMFSTINYIAPLQEPVLWLMRNSGEVEFHENVKGTQFDYQTGDNKNGFIKLNLLKLHKFNFGNNTFKGYIAHENNTLCYPQKPLFDTEEINEIFNKAQRDMANRNIKQYSQYGEAIQKVLIGGAFAFLIYLGAKSVFPQAEVVTVDTAITTSNALVNATVLK